jgi:hypothetical protein
MKLFPGCEDQARQSLPPENVFALCELHKTVPGFEILSDDIATALVYRIPGASSGLCSD